MTQVIKVNRPSPRTIKVNQPSPKTIRVDMPSPGKEPLFLKNIKEHPFRSVFTPLATTITGKSLQDRALDATAPTHIKPGDPLAYWSAFAKQAGSGMAGSVADMATTPATYIPIPVGRVVGKIPFRGTTLGKVASTVPIKHILNKDVATIVKYQAALKNLPARVATSQAPLNNLKLPAVQKVTQAIKDAGPIRAAQEKLYTLERAKRIEKVKGVGDIIKGEKGYFAQLKQLKGELPKINFQGIRGKVSQADIDDLFNTIEVSPDLNQFEKMTAKSGLSKLFGEVGGMVPAGSELETLRRVFPEEFITTVLSKRPILQSIGEGVAEVLNVPRAIMSSFDMSAPLRQGVFLINRPRQWVPAFGKMFKYFANEKSYDNLIMDIQKRPTYKLMTESNLAITRIGKQLSSREEAFMSNLAERIPLFGRVIRASNRAYSGFLDKLRADVFDSMVTAARSQGVDVEGKVLKDMASFINAATGRGNLPSSLSRAAVALNSTFFSPKLMASRINLMNPAYYVNLHPVVRKEALKSLMTFGGVVGTTLGLAKMAGADVGVDPRSADFGKIKIGNTRYDVMGGFQQYLRLIAQLVTGEHVSSTTGVKSTAGEGYKPLTRLDILSRFVETKEAPVFSFATNLLRGQSRGGQKLEMSEELASRFIPMVWQDIGDLANDKGFAKALGMTIPGFFGVGVQTYQATPSDVVRSARSAAKYAKQLYRQGRIEEANKMITDNQDIIDMASKLYTLHDMVGKYEKAKNDVRKSVRLSSGEKNKKYFLYDSRIQELKERMQKIMDEQKIKR